MAGPAGGFIRAAPTPRWGWIEPRAGWDEGPVPAELARASDVVRVRSWTVSAILGDREVAIEGILDWVPVRAHHAAARAPQEMSGWVTLAALAVGMGFLAAAVVVARRLRRP